MEVTFTLQNIFYIVVIAGSIGGLFCKLSNLEHGVKRISEQVKENNLKIDKIEDKIDKVEDKVDALTMRLTLLENEVGNIKNYVENSLDTNRIGFSLQAKLPPKQNTINSAKEIQAPEVDNK